MKLWWVRPESVAASEAALAWLSPEERADNARFIPQRKRHEHLVTRILVRSVLGELLGRAPDSLRFVENPWGRPQLDEAGPVRFNVSHTEGLVTLLVCEEHEVGVDTELLTRAPTLLRLAPNVFAPTELAELLALPVEDQPFRAVTLWTLKESYIKARGMGLALALDGFAFHLSETGHISVKVEPALGDDGPRWHFQSLLLGEHLVSLASAGPIDLTLAPWIPLKL